MQSVRASGERNCSNSCSNNSPKITRKLCCHKHDRAMRPIYGCPENFEDSMTTPTTTIPNILCSFVPMTPSERALVSFYRLSIVTFPLSLRVSEILPLLFSSMPLFPYPTSSFPKFPHVPLGVGGCLLAAKSEGVGLIVCTVSFEDFQSVWSQSTNVTDGRTDGWTTCERKTTLCAKVHCTVKIGQ